MPGVRIVYRNQDHALLCFRHAVKMAYQDQPIEPEITRVDSEEAVECFLCRIAQEKKCEMMGCGNPGFQNFQMAPATNVWLCEGCLESEKLAHAG